MEAEEVREVYHRLTGSTMSHFDAERTVRRSSDAEVNNGFPEVKKRCMHEHLRCYSLFQYHWSTVHYKFSCVQKNSLQSQSMPNMYIVV